MRTIFRSRTARWSVAVAAAAATVAVAVPQIASAAGAPAAAAARHTPHDGYGWTTVRSGIPRSAAHFTVTSPDIRDGGTIPYRHWAHAFGCAGGNQQIRLAWHGAPAGTRGYAVVMDDPDAPTGGGFRHWLTWDVPATAHALGATAVRGAVVGTDDAGITGYLGPCPPAGDVTHHYRFTVYALDTPSLQLPAATPPAVVEFTMSSHILGYARLTADARR
ncbi:YbhB/YbcL family Raf kinase inhibitor-like protein [Streptacidiphilus jiangxiensis]|uniref:Phospholipid-binding protein, PBP family n=1 Tax=Streptacidiphilus jiangxiensis TaxID=235985 RepID=A0A1H7V7L5_STRJI|nr:YbhB/YbcL family Raf kinase inhibitor-like protein [Streptacidiphilus jiangxiensis]SEM04835.1 hypothetical protein SAMN05414137_117121 [Streptacidiphilus jiangxiensis]